MNHSMPIASKATASARPIAISSGWRERRAGPLFVHAPLRYSGRQRGGAPLQIAGAFERRSSMRRNSPAVAWAAALRDEADASYRFGKCGAGALLAAVAGEIWDITGGGTVGCVGEIGCGICVTGGTAGCGVGVAPHAAARLDESAAAE